MSYQLTKNFNSKEFDSPDVPNSGLLIDKILVLALQQMRSEYGKPIKILSGVRSIKQNKKVGGTQDSSHVKNKAVDILVENSSAMFSLLNLALKNGFTRIGVNNNSLHLDIDETKPNHIIWTYY